MEQKETMVQDHARKLIAQVRRVVVGKDQVGIIAAVCALLSEKNVNVMDISQTIMQDIFTMIMLTDITESQKSLSDIEDEMEFEPVPYYINGLAKIHIGLDENLDNLIDDYE